MYDKNRIMKVNFGKSYQINISGILLTLAISLMAFSAFASNTHKQNKENAPVIASLNAYSFSDLLSARDSRGNNEQLYSLFNLLDWCSTQHIKAIDPTAYFFPDYPEVPSDEYLKKFKDRAAELGVTITGTGVRTNFASPDPKVREEGLQLTKDWIVAASKMGAPLVRVFSGAIPAGYEDKWEEVAGWMIPCFKECAVFGEKYGVKIGIQNHGDMLQTAEQCKYVLKAIDSKWAGLILDIGSFKTEDPYKDIAEMIPYAINWQIKVAVAGPGDEFKPTDYVRLMKIIKESGYQGYLPIETLLVKGKTYDPFAEVPSMLKIVSEAIHEVYR
jgi:sugar phosphate isomerase/epimerase